MNRRNCTSKGGRYRYELLVSYRKEVVSESCKDVVLDQFPGQRLPMLALGSCELSQLVLVRYLQLKAADGIQDEEKRHLSMRAL